MKSSVFFFSYPRDLTSGLICWRVAAAAAGAVIVCQIRGVVIRFSPVAAAAAAEAVLAVAGRTQTTCHCPGGSIIDPSSSYSLSALRYVKGPRRRISQDFARKRSVLREQRQNDLSATVATKSVLHESRDLDRRRPLDLITLRANPPSGSKTSSSPPPPLAGRRRP